MSISSAIHNRQLITFRYHGDERTVEPHTHGIDLKGHQALCAFQVAGGSSSGVQVGWKTFHIDEMENLAVLPQTFPRSRDGYQSGDKAFDVIFAEL
ncbi:WYL domain-containing protein [Massilia soli]|uniref:WYL domain-containing protein n=1 Tax=Massilia soli TaxID=2792854 RepID=A0ABS7SR73_9BURK|nr:WYL domain-containing protein [Massilia soli]MBZ2208448.1 WYL domain-containing protein [Massilia soli]